MRFSRLFFVGLFFSILFFSPSSVFAFSGGGSGTSGSPYLITTCSQLQEMANSLSATYLLQNDIDCNGFNYTPVGGNGGANFSGTLNGGGHKITNLTINKPSTTDAGIIGYNDGTITQIGYESGSVDGSLNVGSIAGNNNGTISQSYSKVNVTAHGGNLAVAGGLVGFGYSPSIINDSYARGVPSASTGEVGGLIGDDNGVINRSYATGSVGADGSKAGGITGVGHSDVITDSFATGATGPRANGGGLVGFRITNTITNGFWYHGSGTPDHCNGSIDTGCTAQTQLSYFYTITNAPMSSWDFNLIWSRQTNGVDFPILKWQEAPVTSSSSGSSSAPSCGDPAPTNSPNLFQITSKGNTATLYFVPVTGPNNKYFVSYGLDPTAQGNGVEFAYSDTSGVIPYTVNALFPGTWYFKVRGGNGCMPGNWSAVMSVQVSSFGTTVSNLNQTTNSVLGAATQATAKCQNYTVQSGDSLWKIASNNLGSGTQFKSLMQKNSLNSTLIHTGQKLKVSC